MVREDSFAITECQMSRGTGLYDKEANQPVLDEDEVRTEVELEVGAETKHNIYNISSINIQRMDIESRTNKQFKLSDKP